MVEIMCKVEDIYVYEYSLFKPGKSYRNIQSDRMLKIKRLFNGYVKKDK
jgi:hypothetical protein